MEKKRFDLKKFIKTGKESRETVIKFSRLVMKRAEKRNKLS